MLSIYQDFDDRRKYKNSGATYPLLYNLLDPTYFFLILIIISLWMNLL